MNYNDHEEYLNRSESSVITEIVEEKVVEYESSASIINENEQRNQQINEYLEMDKNEFLNKDEYRDVDGMNSEDDRMKYEEEHEGVHPNEDLEDEYKDKEEGEDDFGGEEIMHAGLQTNFVEEESKHILHFLKEGYEPEFAIIDVEIDDEDLDGNQPREYGNSPIQENEDEQYSTPQDGLLYQDQQFNDKMHLFQIANEVKKKDQGRKFVLWETNEMRNQWDEKIYNTKKHQISRKKLEHHWNNDIERKRDSPKAKAQAFDYSNVEQQNLPITKSKRFYDYIESKVPLLSDHEKAKERKRGRIIETGSSFQNVPRKDHFINNIFLQSSLQEQLQNGKNVNTDKAPFSHHKLNEKIDPKNQMYAGRPIFGQQNANNHIQNASAGRNRIFYSSHIF